MADNASFIPRFSDEEVSAEGRAVMAQLADQNALLRASLAEARERLEEVERIADTDTLTPLPNRRRFIRELERVTAQVNRHGTQAAVLYIDLECLKAVNERHGHFAGDAALIHVARLLAGLIRTTDMAARIGGDEFALILDHLDHNSAIDTAERITRYVASVPLDLGGTQVTLTVSVGIASVLAGDTIDDVLRRADRNIGRAKSRD
jgi:diguanylate cyclase (GGDEF)-like protein